MQDLLIHMLENIIDGPVEVTTSEDSGMTIFEVKVPQDQVGMVIGRGGKTINALKNIIKIRAIRENVRVDIQVSESA